MVALALSIWLTSPAGQLASIQARYASAMVVKPAGFAPLPETVWGAFGRAVMLHRRQVRVGACVDDALDLADATRDDTAAWPAAEWAAHPNRLFFCMDRGPRTLGLLTRRFATHPKVGGLAFYFAAYNFDTDDPGVARLLDAVLARNPNREARGAAHYAKARAAFRRFEEVEQAGGSQTERDSRAGVAIAAFERVVRDFGDCPLGKNSRDLAQLSQSSLYELKHLRVGVVIPDVVGESLRGGPLKLSDTRGKVVVVAFWYTGCYWCMKAVPHERELMERYRGRPFTVFGVCSELTREEGLATARRNRMDWPHLWTGPEGTHAAVLAKWNIDAWPTVYVLDANGVIRAKNVRGADLDAALRELLPDAK